MTEQIKSFFGNLENLFADQDLISHPSDFKNQNSQRIFKEYNLKIEDLIGEFEKLREEGILKKGNLFKQIDEEDPNLPLDAYLSLERRIAHVAVIAYELSMNPVFKVHYHTKEGCKKPSIETKTPSANQYRYAQRCEQEMNNLRQKHIDYINKLIK